MSMITMIKHLSGIVILACLGLTAGAAEQSEVDAWGTYLKNAFFKDTAIIEDKTVVELVTPYRSEDGALTPISIKANIPQSPERYIETLYLIVDRNPQPLAAVFHLTPAIAKADLAMRIRIDQYTNVRAVAILNNGEHHMTANFVKASGGCSAPPAADLKLAMTRLGQMKFRTVGEAKVGEPLVGQLMISHPNITGMQIDQVTRAMIPEHFVKKLEVSYNGKLIFTADTGIAISADPAFRFFFKPEKTGKITAHVMDSKGMEWTENFEVSL
jgi:sulfur-oxidizing protein SoxY